MIQQDKLNFSLYVLYQVFVEARLMAYQQVSHEDIANFLDAAHNMPEQLVVAGDKTAEFRSMLVEVIRIRPKLTNLLARFDSSERTFWELTADERLEFRASYRANNSSTPDPAKDTAE